MLGEDLAATLSGMEEHHGTPAAAIVTAATVRSIQAVYCRYGTDPRTLYPVDGSTLLARRHTADGWEPETADVSFVGYLVEADIHEGHVTAS